MPTATHVCRQSLVARLRTFLLLPALLCAMSAGAYAQLSGTYTIDPDGSGTTNYTSIENAITALNTSGVSGPVTFRIASGTYTPPGNGYVLATAAGMSTTNTVTFKPATNASVVIDADIDAPVFDFSGGDFFIIDGSNAAGGTSCDLTASNQSTSGMVVRFTAGATLNTIKNVYMIGAGTSTTYPMVRFDNVASGILGNSNNTISGNIIGDTTGTTRSYNAIYSAGASTNAPNIGNRIENNYINNFGYSTSVGYGIYISTYTQVLRIIGNRITIPTKNTTGSSYGIYWTNNANFSDTIAYNRIWDLSTGSATATQYGMYMATLGTSPMVLHHNMISLIADQGTLYGMYISAATTSVLNIYYNSIHIGGRIATASTTSRCINITSSQTVTLTNNTLSNERFSTGSNTNIALYRGSTAGTFNSNYNVLWASGNAITGYYSTNQATLANWQTASGKDANSSSGVPRFIDPANGNLHISTTKRTPVESRGTPITGITTDVDGTTRSATTPDAGADEGAFLTLLANDMSAELFLTPTADGTVLYGTSFTPSAIVYNNGTSNRTSVPVRMRIWNNSNGNLVYNDLQTVASISALTALALNFNQTGNVSGSTTLSMGFYTVELRTEYTGDGDTTNNAIYTTIAVKAPLSGTYTIDPNGSGITNYPTFTAAVSDVNSLGVSGAVVFEIASGTYGANEKFPLTLKAAPGMSSTNTITFRPASGANPHLIGASAAGIFVLDSGDYYTFNGTNTTNGTTRNWKVSNQSNGPVIRFINGATSNTVRNMNLMGSSTSTTSALVHISTTAAAVGNSNNTIISNTLGDSTGTLRNYAGVYMLGTSTSPNLNTRIENNDIINAGATTGYGIYVSSYNQLTKIIRNRITQTVLSASGSKYGIYFSNSYSLLDTIAYNKIWRLNTQSATSIQYGMYVGGQGPSPIVYHNNMVSLVADEGTLYGFYYTQPDTLYAYHNSIYIGGSSASTSTTSYAFGNTSTGAVTLRNNIFLNERSSTGSNTNRVLYISSSSSNLNSNYNMLYASGASTALGYMYVNGTAGYYATLPDWIAGTARDSNSVTGNPQFIDRANGELHISTTQRTPVEGTAIPIAGISTDFDGDTRSTTMPDIGADEGSFLALHANDMAADRFLSPDGTRLLRYQTTFQPTAVVMNVGTNTQTSVQVQYKITNASTGVVAYQDIRTTGTLGDGESQTVTFGATGNVSGSTALAAGTYNVELRTLLGSDINTSNNVITMTVTAREPLSGLYTINANGSGSRNFLSFTEACNVLTAVGVSAAVVFEVAGGYTAVGEDFPIKLTPALGISASSNVTFRPASGANILMSADVATSYLFDIDGGDFYLFDGTNSANGTTRNWKIVNGVNGGIFRFINGASNNTVRNMNLMTGATTTTYSPITISTATAATGGNSYNVIRNNTIGDSLGIERNIVGVYMLGSSVAPNIGTVIDGNDIINFGATTGYGVYVSSYNQLTKILRNRITQNLLGNSGTKYGIYFSNSYSLNDTIAYNRIWRLNTTGVTSAQYGIYIPGQAASPLVIHNNMISLISEQGTLYGIYESNPDSLFVENNSIYIGGFYMTGTSTSYVYYNSGASSFSWLRNNVLVNERASTGSNTNRVIYVTSATSTLNSDYNVINTSGGSTVPFYFGGTYYTSLAGWYAGTGRDQHSYSASVPFIDVNTNDLHIDPRSVFRGEGVGATLGYPLDIDQQARDQVAVDIGADDGDFNGDGLRIISPNGGEKAAAEYNVNVRFSANRVMAVRVDLSTNGGTTWIAGPTLTTVAGINTIAVPTPDTVTNRALVRVVSTRNQYEFDEGDATFDLVRPVFTIIAPNGGERFVPTDTTRLQWTSQFVPPDVNVELEYSTNAGTSWLPIAGGIPSTNQPAVNSFNWEVPNAPTQQAMVRVKIGQSSSKDASNNVFTITQQPAVTITKPNGGEKYFADDTRTIEWTSVMTDYLKLEYSTDNGISWSTIIPRVAAYRGRYEWTLPDVTTASALVRATNNERPRFVDLSDNVFSILQDEITVTAPNGGEKYELNDPVTVRWNSSGVATVRIDYSSNGGLNWMTVAQSVPGSAGSYTFTPQQVPTKLAVVRVVNAERELTQDRSDKSFEIMEPKSITVTAPGLGDQFVRGSTTVITWNAPRVNNVNIQYSSNGGANWITVASNIQAATGSYVWTVPNGLTSQGMIRISEVGGSIIAESGIFSIVDQTISLVQVIAPNGGESYTEGDPIQIRWTATPDLTKVGLSYSSDGGSTWTTISSNLMASAGQYNWRAPSVPGTQYRVKVDAGTISDMSDNNFTVARKPQPKLTLLYPNGGEKLVAGKSEAVTWASQDISGMVSVEYSTDKGSAWKPVGTATAASGTLNWVIPDEPSVEALVRVVSLDLSTVADTSNDVFTIEKEAVAPLVLTSPNGGEKWVEKETRQITWNSPVDVTQVEFHYSVDGGQNWKLIAGSASTTGANSYDWTIPQESTTQALVRVRSTADTARQDISDAEFAITYSTSGVAVNAVAGRSVLTVMGVYPNPFAASAELRWMQGVTGEATLRIFDGSGRLVRVESAGRLESGEHRLVVNAGELPGGAYHYELRVGGTTAHGTMMIVR